MLVLDSFNENEEHLKPTCLCQHIRAMNCCCLYGCDPAYCATAPSNFCWKFKTFAEMIYSELSFRALLSAFSHFSLNPQQMVVKCKSLTCFSKPGMLVSAVNHSLNS